MNGKGDEGELERIATLHLGAWEKDTLRRKGWNGGLAG